jgi:hypothetical protein
MCSLFGLALPFGGATSAASTSNRGSVDIAVNTTVDPVYDVFGSGASQVVASVNATLQTTSIAPVEIISSFRPSDIIAYAVVNGSIVSIPVSVFSGRFGTHFGLDFSLPANTTSFSMTISGSQSGSGFLWRYISEVPSVNLVSSPALGVIERSYTSRVTLPHGTAISGAFFLNGTQITVPGETPTSVAGDSQEYVVEPFVKTVILQSTWFVPGSIAVASLGVLAFVLASLNKFGFWRRWVHEAFGGLSSRLNNFGPRNGPSVAQTTSSLSARIKGVFRPKKLLALFLLCSVMMVSLGAIAGPYPSMKAYVVAAPGSVTAIHRSLQLFDRNVVVLTPSQDYSDFEVMSSVADFNIVVISNYPTLALPRVSGFLLRGLANVPVIVIDNNTDTTFAKQIDALYGNRLIAVQNASSLSPSERQLIAEQISSTARVRLLGLDLTVVGFKSILLVEGALSFVLIFLGWAFLGSLASEARVHSDFSQLATVVSSGLFVFLFSEVIYVTTSIILAFPLSLHAVISGAKDITAVGYLGFGGGSTPRLAAGFAGMMLGIGLTKGAPRLEKTDLAIILGIGLFILADPLLLGQFAFTGLLLFFGNFAFGSAFASSLSLKGFIYGVGSVFGGSVNSTYLMSAGKMLYFAGLVPFAYLRQMGKTTTSFMALLSALLIGDGGVRVGEMTPDKTVIAVVPGLIVGFAFLIVMLSLASAEKYLRRGQSL